MQWLLLLLLQVLMQMVPWKIGVTKGDGAAAASAAAHEGAAAPLEAEGDSKQRKFVPYEANRDINVHKQTINTGGQSLAEIRAANEAANKQQQQHQAAVCTTNNQGRNPFCGF